MGMFSDYNVWQNGSMKVLVKKVWQIDVQLSLYTMGSVSLDGFSLVKLLICQIYQTFPLPKIPTIWYLCP